MEKQLSLTEFENQTKERREEIKGAKGLYELPEGWKWVRLRDLVTLTQYGISKPLNTDNIGIPIIRMNNITNDGRLDLSDIKCVSVDEDVSLLQKQINTKNNIELCNL